jgi:aminoglycoside phosphotransferase (APT) family kinase protein
VVKRYVGPEAAARRRRELTALTGVAGLVPVPPVLSAEGDDTVRMRFVDGEHGQDLIESGYAAEVLFACGLVLRRIHRVDTAHVWADAASRAGPVVVHGDFGPNNVLIDPARYSVTAVLDWEWTCPGRAVEDLAWCEWIIRTHHPDAVGVLDEFFEAYGRRPPWSDRHAAMLARCEQLLDFCRGWTDDGVRLWRRRLDQTAQWVE